MTKRERPSFRRPRSLHAAVPLRHTKPGEGPAEQDLPAGQRKPRCGPYVVEWQLEDTLNQQTPDGMVGDSPKPAYAG
jgi:hypothetical protein